MITINYDINQPIWNVFLYYFGAWYVTLEECKISAITVKNDMSLGIRVYRKSTQSSNMIPGSFIDNCDITNDDYYFTNKDRAEEIYEKLVEQATRRNSEIKERKEEGGTI